MVFNQEQNEFNIGALNCYRVLDLADEKGVFCGKILGDLGADVIKVEKPGGDTMRCIGPFFDDSCSNENSIYWAAYNSSKRGITLDITKAKGQEVFKNLVKTADILVESFNPGYMDGLGLGYHDLCKINPDIIVTSITPFGQTGPKSNHIASDLTLWASGGQMFSMGSFERPPLRPTFPPNSYLHAGAQAAIGSLIALFHRQATGEGQQVDVSVQESVVNSLSAVTEYWDLMKQEYMRNGYRYVTDTGVGKRYGLPCKDGFVTIFMLGGGTRASVRTLQQLVKMMDDEGKAPEWLKQINWVSDYNTETASQELIDRVEKAIGDFLLTKTKKELYEETITKSLLIAPFMDARDIAQNDQLQARRFWVQTDDSELGRTITHCGPFSQLSETPINIFRAPHVGEHNDDIYIKEMGFSDIYVDTLRKENII